MAEPFAVGLHAIQVSQVKPNDRVLILGGGIIGMSCAEWARTFGASEITVSELNPQKREIIRGYQVADHVVAADAPDLEQQLLDISGGGYDLLIDCVGVPSAFNTGLRALKPEFYMRATAVGLPHAQFPLDYERLVLKQVLLRGSKGHNFDEFKTVINAMASGRILRCWLPASLPLPPASASSGSLSRSPIIRSWGLWEPTWRSFPEISPTCAFPVPALPRFLPVWSWDPNRAPSSPPLEWAFPLSSTSSFFPLASLPEALFWPCSRPLLPQP